MSLHAAIVEASHEVLKDLLAPEMAERVAQQIVEKVEPRLEAALVDFLGMELGRDGAVKKRAPKGKASKAKNVAADDTALEELATHSDPLVDGLEALS